MPNGDRGHWRQLELALLETGPAAAFSMLGPRSVSSSLELARQFSVSCSHKIYLPSAADVLSCHVHQS